MSPRKIVTHPPRAPAALDTNGSRPRTRSNASRADAINRLERLRGVVPVFAKELVIARRQAAWLRAENSWLIEHVRQLQRERSSSRPVSMPTTTSER